MIEALLSAFDIDSQNLLQEYEMGKITLLQWKQKMQELLAQYHLAGMMTGMGTTDITPQGLDIVRQNLNVGQYPYLDNFASVMAAAPEFNPAWKSRVRLYSLSPKQSYQEGKVWRTAGKFLPLPAMPAQGTTCLSNCLCSWRIERLDNDDNWDCYWVREADDSCQTCIQREKDWSPVKIRDGMVVSWATKEVAEKHLSGQHDQKKHGYRFGSAPKLSRARNLKKDGLWDDYKKRARERGSDSKKSKVMAIIKKPKSDYKSRPKSVLDVKGRVEFDTALENQYNPWYQKLSNTHKWAMERYTNGRYWDINEALRSGAGPSGMVKTDKAIFNRVSESLNKESLKSDIMLYRGFAKPADSFVSQIASLKPGQVWQDRGFSSTSTKPRGAGIWGEDKATVFFKIRAPKGTKGAYIGPNSNYPKEKEFLLPAGQNYYIHNVTPTNDGRYIVEVTALP